MVRVPAPCTHAGATRAKDVPAKLLEKDLPRTERVNTRQPTGEPRTLLMQILYGLCGTNNNTCVHNLVICPLRALTMRGCSALPGC